MDKKIAVYPGSFDPPTLGHLDLITRARAIFDHVIVGIAENTSKNYMFTVPERVAMMEEMTQDVDGVEISTFATLTVEFARTRGAIAVVRGLRVISDFEYELSMAINNQKFNPDLDTVCLMPSEQYLYLSSHLVKEVATFGGPLDNFVTAAIAEKLREKIGRK